MTLRPEKAAGKRGEGVTKEGTGAMVSNSSCCALLLLGTRAEMLMPTAVEFTAQWLGTAMVSWEVRAGWRTASVILEKGRQGKLLPLLLLLLLLLLLQDRGRVAAGLMAATAPAKASSGSGEPGGSCCFPAGLQAWRVRMAAELLTALPMRAKQAAPEGPAKSTGRGGREVALKAAVAVSPPTATVAVKGTAVPTGTE